MCSESEHICARLAHGPRLTPRLVDRDIPICLCGRPARDPQLRQQVSDSLSKAYQPRLALCLTAPLPGPLARHGPHSAARFASVCA